MQTVYNMTDMMGVLSVVSAQTDVVVYGIGGQVDISSYFYGEEIAIRFSFIPKSGKDHVNGAIVDNTVRVQKKTLLGNKNVEQKISAHPLSFELFEFGDVANKNMNQGKDDAQRAIKQFEAFIERTRHLVINQINPNVQRAVFSRLDSFIYSDHTAALAEKFIQQINWSFLLKEVIDKEWATSFADTMEAWKGSKYYKLSCEYGNESVSKIDLNVGDSIVNNIRQIRRNIQEETSRLNSQKASVVAYKLLERVVGKDAVKEYSRNRHITVIKDDWTFKLSRSGGKIISPSGKIASMCVHTNKYDCHAIDEVVIKYLYLKQKTYDFLQKAIIHGDNKFNAELKRYKFKLRKEK